MKSYTLICNYCDHRWKATIYKSESYSCPICGDKDLKAVENVDAYGYESNAPKEDAYIRRKRDG